MKVTIYSVPDCPHTKALREFLKEKGVDFEMKCVLDDPRILEEMYKISGQRGVPVTVIDNDVFVGYDRMIERRMTRRLGGK
ncbi:MAG: glutaredoxin domain-containing protein [Candidatus Thorarchaeota archaeon]